MAGLGLDARKDDAALFSTQLSGDAAAAGDFTVTVSTVDTGTYKLYLYHDLGLDMGGEAECEFSLETGLRRYSSPLNWLNLRNRLNCNWLSDDFEEEKLPEPYRSLAAETARARRAEWRQSSPDWFEVWPRTSPRTTSTTRTGPHPLRAGAARAGGHAGQLLRQPG